MMYYYNKKTHDYHNPIIQVCGRTAQNNTPSETLVFHQTLSTPKVRYFEQFRRAHPKGELE